MYHNHRVALLVDSNERTILKNFFKMMDSSDTESLGPKTKIDKSHFERLKNLILIHIDIGQGTPGTNSRKPFSSHITITILSNHHESSFRFDHLKFSSQ